METSRSSDARLAGRTLAVATEADFHYATELFVAFHTTGGSLSEKFDRNEHLVLSLAWDLRAEQSMFHDAQRWTGWNYRRSCRRMLGYESRSVRYPPLSLNDRTVSTTDNEGRDVRRRPRRSSPFTAQAWSVR